jgi:ribonuclease Z
MRPTMYPRLVNGRFGDPALFVEILHRRDALLFDLGDINALSARDLLRIGHVFVTHMHMDHFIGFDTLLRVSVGREKTIRLAGPRGLCDRIFHKLQGYEWDLVERYATDLVLLAREIGEDGPLRAVRFAFKRRFAWDEQDSGEIDFHDAGDGFRLEWAILEHHGPSIGYAVREPAHANVWKSKLDERDLPTGHWLQSLKAAVLAGAADEHPIEMPDGTARPLADLRDFVTISRGQKIAYVTDIADTPANRAAVARLAEEADLFFIESRFAADDADQARVRAHLTTTAAGEMARAAGVRKLEPFHFSPRYEGEEQRMLDEVFAACGPELTVDMIHKQEHAWPKDSLGTRTLP